MNGLVQSRACACGYTTTWAGPAATHTCIGTPCRGCGAALRPAKMSPIPGHETRPISGNGLCRACASRERRGGIARQVIRADDLLDEWVRLRDDGYRYYEAAVRIGTTPGALDRALCRAKRRGDPRGSRVPFAHDMRGQVVS
ncbi:MAG: hypothetical protein ACRDOJ_05110 [Nocardioidaceae bacterium]